MGNILIIGGAGFIGVNLARKLYSGNEITILDNFKNRSKLFKELGNHYTIVNGGFEQTDRIINVIRRKNINLIIHLASKLIPSSSFAEYKCELSNIVAPTLKLLPYLAERKVKILFFSSGGTIYGIPESIPISETASTNPISFYGLSKKIIEDSIIFEHRTAGLEFVIVRPSNPYGNGQDINGKQGLISVAIGNILANKNITVFGDGNIIRDYIYIEDLVSAIFGLINCGINNEIINVGSGVGTTINEILQLLKVISKRNFNVDYVEFRSVDVPSVILNIDKIKNMIAFNPITLSEGISLYYNTISNTTCNL